LRQVLLNLVGNAVKFTENRAQGSGRVVLRVEPVSLTNGLAGVRLRVSDNGIGMRPETLERLFRPFTQADESTARRYGGTGLGLSICQRLVHLMGGQISVCSTLGVGSEFTVELPLQESPPGRTLPVEPNLAGLQVLVLTRDELAAQMLPAYCTAAGAKVALVADLSAAQQYLQQHPSSESTVVLVCGVSTDPTAAVELVSSAVKVHLVRRSKHEIGEEAVVLVRPLLYRELIAGVAIAAGRLKAPELVKPSQPERVAGRRTAPLADQAARSGHLILVAEDNETNRDVLVEQLRLLGYAAELASDGVQALQMWRDGRSAQADQRDRYALLLTDCHMPHMSGFELCQAIRQSESPDQRLPIIAITANAMQGEAERCRERGMDDYLSKPLRLGELGHMLTKWIPAPAVAEISTASNFDKTLLVWNRATLTELIGDNPAMHRRLLEKFLINAKFQVAAILAATSGGDVITVAGESHTLKSAARSVGALALGELCDAIESASRAGDTKACQALNAGLPDALAAATLLIEQHLAS
jgi:CheY-like chemotaxis protein